MFSSGSPFSPPKLEPLSINNSAMLDVENTAFHRFVPKLNLNQNEGPLPDSDLFANSYVRLSCGITAYYIVDPPSYDSSNIHISNVPIILCLHGCTNSSYMYRDLAEHLCTNTNSRVLAFDFYGRGRSPWTGVKCNIETFVSQTMELLQYLNISSVSCVIGYDIGAAVAAALVTKYNNSMPRQFTKVCLLSPIGLLNDEYQVANRNIFKTKVLGDLMMKCTSKAAFIKREIQANYFDSRDSAYHYPMIQKASAMISFQWENTPGYLGSFLCTLRHFSLTGLKDLYGNMRRLHTTPVCVITGRNDRVLPTLNSVSETTIAEIFCSNENSLMQNSNETVQNRYYCLDECGHQVLFEEFDEVIEILIRFINNLDDR